MLILHNARIYTGFLGKPVVTAILIHEDRILATGTDDEIIAAAPAGTPKQDLAGKTILPGLVDSHMHFKHFSLGLQRVNCETPTIDECLQNIAAKAAVTPPGNWIIGWGWNHNVWDGYGTAAQLDTVAPENPVFLSAKSGHAAWVNSKAMQLSGLNATTPDPAGGVIQRDSSNNPSGILFETAESIVSKHLPEPSLSDLSEAVLLAQPELWKIGITGLHDFDSLDLFAVLQQLDQEAKLGLRIVKGIPLDKIDHAVEIHLRSGFGSDYLRTGSVKVFADGALGPQTAAMLEPFEDSIDLGILLLKREQFLEIGMKASSNGLSLAIHAIGDLANREVLNAYEDLRIFEKEHGYSELRHRIEHVQLLHPQDLARLSKLNVIASMQPIHATSDMYISDKYWGKRASGAYAFRTLLEHKTHLTFGSDSPVETPNPFVGIHAAVTRRRADGSPGIDGWYPNQRLTLEEALYAYTSSPAFASGLENRSGSLASGFYADLIVLDDDPFNLALDELHCQKPSATMVGGKWVWQKHE